MNYIELFITALTALKSNILRTALTMLGIIIGIASVILIISLAQGATTSITAQVSSLGTNLIFISAGSQNRGPVAGSNIVKTLTYEDAQAIGKLPHISAVSATLGTKLQVVANGLNTNVLIQGVQSGYETTQAITMDKGNFISADDELGYGNVAVLGPQVVTDVFGEGADVVGQSVAIGSKFFRIIGVTHARGGNGFVNPDDMVYIPVTTMMTTLLGQTYVSSIQADADDPKTVDQTMSDTTDLLLDRHKITDAANQDFTIQSSKSVLATLGTITSLLTAMLAGIAAISLLVGGIGIMNIMLVTVTERTKEIGLLKAIGATRSDILVQFLIESIVLTLSGGTVGIILGVSLSFLLSNVLLHIPFVMSLTSILLAVGVSSVVGLVFGLYPAQRAARLSPIDALRYE